LTVTLAKSKVLTTWDWEKLVVYL